MHGIKGETRQQLHGLASLRSGFGEFPALLLHPPAPAPPPPRSPFGGLFADFLGDLQAGVVQNAREAEVGAGDQMWFHVFGVRERALGF